MQRRLRKTVTASTEGLLDPPRPSIRCAYLPPGPSELPLVGQAFRLRFSLLQEAATYGDVSTVAVNPILIYLVNHPDLNRQVLVREHQNAGRGATAFEIVRWMMRDGLVASTGAFHLKQRRMIQPRFHRRYIEHYAGAMTEVLRAKCGRVVLSPVRGSFQNLMTAGRQLRRHSPTCPLEGQSGFR